MFIESIWKNIKIKEGKNIPWNNTIDNVMQDLGFPGLNSGCLIANDFRQLNLSLLWFNHY